MGEQWPPPHLKDRFQHEGNLLIKLIVARNGVENCRAECQEFFARLSEWHLTIDDLGFEDFKGAFLKGTQDRVEGKK
jgi:hypothetical protein